MSLSIACQKHVSCLQMWIMYVSGMPRSHLISSLPSAFYVILFIFCKYVVKYSYIIVVLDFYTRRMFHVTCIGKKIKVYMYRCKLRDNQTC